MYVCTHLSAGISCVEETAKLGDLGVASQHVTRWIGGC